MIILPRTLRRYSDRLFSKSAPALARILAKPSQIKDGETGKALRLINFETFENDLIEAKENIIKESIGLIDGDTSYTKASSWDFDSDTQKLTFEFEGNHKKTCKARFLIGHDETFSDTLWAWADDRFSQKERNQMMSVLGYGLKNNYDLMTTPQFVGCPEGLLWTLAGISAKIIDLPYVLKVPVDDVYFYLVAATYPTLEDAT